MLQGEFFTITLSHNMETLDDQYVECGSVDMHGRPSRLAGRMEGKGRIHDGMGEVCYMCDMSFECSYLILLKAMEIKMFSSCVSAIG